MHTDARATTAVQVKTLQPELPDSLQAKAELIQDRLSVSLARFICSKLDAAVNRQQSLQVDSKSPLFLDCLRAVWPVQGRSFIIPEEMFDQPVGGKLIRYYPVSSDAALGRCYHANGTFSSFDFFYECVGAARNTTEQKSALRELKAKVFHECGHIFHQGSDLDLSECKSDRERAEHSVRYLSNTGEIRAHALEAAALYTERFPGAPLNQQNIEAMQPDLPKALQAYIFRMQELEVQERYATIAVLAHVHTDFMKQMATFIDLLQK